MLQESLFGRAEPKKTFNVEANLLAERHAYTLTVVRSAHRTIAGIGAAFLLGIAVLPWLFHLQSSAGSAAKVQAQKAAELAKELSGLVALRDASAPKAADSELVSASRRYAEMLIGQCTAVLNATPRTAAISSLRADVNGGIITLTCSAEADRFDAMREFLAKAAAGASPQSTVLSSSRRSDNLGLDGVAFEFVKKVEAGR